MENPTHADDILLVSINGHPGSCVYSDDIFRPSLATHLAGTKVQPGAVASAARWNAISRRRDARQAPRARQSDRVFDRQPALCPRAARRFFQPFHSGRQAPRGAVRHSTDAAFSSATCSPTSSRRPRQAHDGRRHHARQSDSPSVATPAEFYQAAMPTRSARSSSTLYAGPKGPPAGALSSLKVSHPCATPFATRHSKVGTTTASAALPPSSATPAWRWRRSLLRRASPTYRRRSDTSYGTRPRRPACASSACTGCSPRPKVCSSPRPMPRFGDAATASTTSSNWRKRLPATWGAI